MRLGDLVLIDIWPAAQVRTSKHIISVIILLLFEVIITDCAGGLKSPLEIKTIIVLFFDDILINASPLFFQSFPF
jgi:hypothetical protein